MKINNFLKQFVEGYLFCDIENMLQIELKNNQIYGACGYPIMMSILSGMELLGGLLSEKYFDKFSGDQNFKNYWENYFCAYNSKYKISENTDVIIRKLIRHGLTHVFLTKPGIFITKGNEDIHWKFEDKSLSIDVKEFYIDFKNSYYKSVEGKESSMQNRLNEMINEYSKEADKFLGEVNLEKASMFKGDNYKTLISNVSTMGSPAFSTTLSSIPASGIILSTEDYKNKIKKSKK